MEVPAGAPSRGVPPTLTVQGIGPNSFQKFDRLKTAADRFVVTPNNLTIDAYAILDVSDGPVVLYVPAFSAPRYFIVQIGDVFDDVIHKVAGARPAVPGAYIITGPEHQGRVPGDMTQVSLRTKLGFAAVRDRGHRLGRPARRPPRATRVQDDGTTRLPRTRHRVRSGRLRANPVPRADRPARTGAL